MAGPGRPGRKAHPPRIVEECKRLLLTMSQRKVAILLQISRGSVQAIQHGTHLQAVAPTRRKVKKPVRCRCGLLLLELPCVRCTTLRTMPSDERVVRLQKAKRELSRGRAA